MLDGSECINKYNLEFNDSIGKSREMLFYYNIIMGLEYSCIAHHDLYKSLKAFFSATNGLYCVPYLISVHHSPSKLHQEHPSIA